MKINKYVKIALLAAAVLLVVIIILLAAGKDNGLFPSREDPAQTESAKEGITYVPFDDSNIGEWN